MLIKLRAIPWAITTLNSNHKIIHSGWRNSSNTICFYQLYLGPQQLHTYLAYTQERWFSQWPLFQPESQTFMHNVKWYAYEKQVRWTEGRQTHSSKLLAPFPMLCQTGATTKMHSHWWSKWRRRRYLSFVKSCFIRWMLEN